MKIQTRLIVIIALSTLTTCQNRKDKDERYEVLDMYIDNFYGFNVTIDSIVTDSIEFFPDMPSLGGLAYLDVLEDPVVFVLDEKEDKTLVVVALACPEGNEWTPRGKLLYDSMQSVYKLEMQNDSLEQKEINELFE